MDPENNMTPLNSVRMEGEFYRALAVPKRGRPRLLRFLGIVAGGIFLLGGISMVLLGGGLAILRDESWTPVDILIGIIFILLGCVISGVGWKFLNANFSHKRRR